MPATTTQRTPPSPPRRGNAHQDDWADNFVAFVQELCQKPQARGALRREQGRPLDRSPETARHLNQRIPRQATEASLRAWYTVARLMAAQVRVRRDDAETRADTGPMALGTALAAAVTEEALAERSAELELDTFAHSSPEAVVRRLPSLSTQLRDVPLDWAALLRDLMRLDRRRDEITSGWQRDFYRARAREDACEPPADQAQFVAAVLRVCDEPGARADLTKGLALPVAACHPLHRHLVRLLPEDMHPAAERAHYAVASLIADRPPQARTAEGAAQETEQRGPSRADLGTALAQAVSRQIYRAQAAEEDLHLIARQGADSLHHRLPGLLRRLQTGGVTVDWTRLIDDLSWWEHHRARIAARWLDHYFDFRPARPLHDHHD